MSTENRQRVECPQCGGPVSRIRRFADERFARVGSPLRRHRCASVACGWEGLLETVAATPQLAARGRRLSGRSRRIALAGAALAGLVFGLVGAQAWQMHERSSSDRLLARLAAGQPIVPFGESHEGDPLPADHPLLAAAQADAPAAVAAQDGERATPPMPGMVPEDGPITLRQNCAWGNPGSNPYRGSVEQALEGARLPPDVVARIAKMVRAGEVTDRLEITTASIRTVHQYREYDPSSVAMTFGKTLCVNSRVNFKPGHVERADLYEVADASGATWSVMVPYVCGNVSVLSDRAEHPDAVAAAPVMVPGPDGTPVLRKASAPLPLLVAAGVGGSSTALPGARTTPEGRVPVPGTLANLLGAAGVLAWFLWRRRDRSGATDAD